MTYYSKYYQVVLMANYSLPAALTTSSTTASAASKSKCQSSTTKTKTWSAEANCRYCWQPRPTKGKCGLASLLGLLAKRFSKWLALLTNWLLSLLEGVS